MIGTNKELLFYVTLTSGWYKSIGLDYKTASRIKSRIRNNEVSDSYCDSLLDKLGFIKVRGSYEMCALFTNNNIVMDEYTLINLLTRDNSWYKGFCTRYSAKDIKLSLKKKTLTERRAIEIANHFGYRLLSKRIMLPSIWEKVSSGNDKAYTKPKIVHTLIMNKSEIL